MNRNNLLALKRLETWSKGGLNFKLGEMYVAGPSFRLRAASEGGLHLRPKSKERLLGEITVTVFSSSFQKLSLEVPLGKSTCVPARTTVISLLEIPSCYIYHWTLSPIYTSTEVCPLELQSHLYLKE